MKQMRKRPEEQAKNVLAAENGLRAPKKVAKTFTTMKDASAESDGSTSSGIGRPTDEQLARINQYTRSAKNADEVAVFNTLSCNDIMDRDLDRFRTSCIKSFASMPEPYSPVGKPFMVSHDTTKLPVGKLFGVDTKRVGDNLFLTNEVYIPNTEQYKAFLENVDFGIYSAVSVGVVLNQGICSIGDEHDYMGKWWCSQGHEKGMHYDPKSDEVDTWGWPLPCEPSTKGAVMCTRDFDDPADFYELSQVYLGAQFGAELDKDPHMSGLVKASKQFGGFVNLGAAEAEKLPIRHTHPEVVNAKLAGDVIEKEDGTARWVDADGYIKILDPDSGDVLTTGKEAEPGQLSLEKASRDQVSGLSVKLTALKLQLMSATEDDGHVEHVAKAQSASDVLAKAVVALDNNDSAVAGESIAVAKTAIEDLQKKLGIEDQPDPHITPDTSKNEKDHEEGEHIMSKKRIQAAAREAHLPATVLDKLAAANEDEALEVFMTATGDHLVEQTKLISQQAPLAEAGTAYLKSLRDSAKRAFILARQKGDTNKAVDTGLVDQLITLAGDDADLLKKLQEEYHSEAQSAFPAAVRRSSFPTDPLPTPGSDSASEAPPSTQQDRFLSRIHQ